MTRAIATAVLTASLLSGCATGYHSVSNPLLGWTGGYWDRPGPGELIKVGFAGNGYSKEAKVEDYLMLRCAEVAHERNKPYFSIYGSIAEAIIGQRHTRDLVTPLTGGTSGVAYLLLEDEAKPGTLVTAEVLAKYAHIRKVAKAPTDKPAGAP
ncbi:hypothetical protein V1318_18530 [Lysobacter sp. CCNWLW3]|uniref:CC0125/CC1285 family lipoprotein n=1 Tax=unclassified Lysobacter TaxID=2635362 RepID=UPI002FD50672